MSFNPQYDGIGKSFVQEYYLAYDTLGPEERGHKLITFYHRDALFIFEDDHYQGPEKIFEKFKSLPFQRISHQVTKCDCQPLMDGSILVMVTGQLKTDEDPPHGFSQVFVLRGENNTFSIMHEIFRLILHNA